MTHRCLADRCAVHIQNDEMPLCEKHYDMLRWEHMGLLRAVIAGYMTKAKKVLEARMKEAQEIFDREEKHGQSAAV